MDTQTLTPGPIGVERSGSDEFVLRGAETQLATIRRGADGWKLWLRSCEVEFGGLVYRTQAAMWKPVVTLVDEHGVTIARDTLNGSRHSVELNGDTFIGDGSHDVEGWRTTDGTEVLELRWSGTYPELSSIEVWQPIAAFGLVVLAAFALHAGSARGGDRQSW